MPSLFQLPFEVLSLAVGELDTQGLLNLRLASKHANSIALPTFVKRHFETRYVMLNRLSLENLIEISRHQAFSTAVKAVEICLDHLTDEPNTAYIATTYLGDMLAQYGEPGLQARLMMPSGGEGGGAVEGRQNLEEEDQTSEKSGLEEDELILDRRAYDELLEDQKFMMGSGLATAYLVQAFSALSSTESVVVNNTSRPWGAAAQRRLTGLFPTNTMDDDYDSMEYVEWAIPAILSAIAASKMSLRRLDICPGWVTTAISPDMLAFSKACQRYLQDLPASLTSLALVMSPASRMGKNDRWTSDFLGFMALFPDIQRLELAFAPRDENKRLSHIAQMLRLRNLQYFSIDAVDCAAEDLAIFLLGHKDTLKEVDLTSIGIPGGIAGWHSLLFTIRDKLSIKVLSMDHCASGYLDVFYRDVDGDSVVQLDDFTIKTEGDWSDIIGKITLGRPMPMGHGIQPAHSAPNSSSQTLQSTTSTAPKD